MGVNKEVAKLLPVEEGTTRSPYLRVIPDQKATVAKYASENDTRRILTAHQKKVLYADGEMHTRLN